MNKLNQIKKVVDLLKENLNNTTIFVVKNDCVKEFNQHLEKNNIPGIVKGVKDYNDHCELVANLLKNKGLKALRDNSTEQVLAGHALKMDIDHHWTMSVVTPDREWHHNEAADLDLSLLADYETVNRKEDTVIGATVSTA